MQFQEVLIKVSFFKWWTIGFKMKLICDVESLKTISEFNGGSNLSLLFSVFWVDGHQRAPVPNGPELTLNGTVKYKDRVCVKHNLCKLFNISKGEKTYSLLTWRSCTGHIDIKRYFSLSSVEQTQYGWTILSISLTRFFLSARVSTYLVNLCSRYGRDGLLRVGQIVLPKELFHSLFRYLHPDHWVAHVC